MLHKLCTYTVSSSCFEILGGHGIILSWIIDSGRHFTANIVFCLIGIGYFHFLIVVKYLKFRLLILATPGRFGLVKNMFSLSVIRGLEPLFESLQLQKRDKIRGKSIANSAHWLRYKIISSNLQFTGSAIISCQIESVLPTTSDVVLGLFESR